MMMKLFRLDPTRLAKISLFIACAGWVAWVLFGVAQYWMFGSVIEATMAERRGESLTDLQSLLLLVPDIFGVLLILISFALPIFGCVFGVIALGRKTDRIGTSVSGITLNGILVALGISMAYLTLYGGV
jgi:hypothetical protein